MWLSKGNHLRICLLLFLFGQIYVGSLFFLLLIRAITIYQTNHTSLKIWKTNNQLTQPILLYSSVAGHSILGRGGRGLRALGGWGGRGRGDGGVLPARARLPAGALPGAARPAARAAAVAARPSRAARPRRAAARPRARRARAPPQRTPAPARRPHTSSRRCSAGWVDLSTLLLNLLGLTYKNLVK